MKVCDYYGVMQSYKIAFSLFYYRPHPRPNIIYPIHFNTAWMIAHCSYSVRFKLHTYRTIFIRAVNSFSSFFQYHRAELDNREIDGFPSSVNLALQWNYIPISNCIDGVCLCLVAVI